MEIRVDCYLAVLDKYKKKHPKAHFEVITRKDNDHPVSPSWELVKNYTDETYDWERYKIEFINEIYANEVAIRRLIELKAIAGEKTLFLVCLEVDSKQCHRTLVKWLMDRMEGDRLPLMEVALETMRMKFKKEEGVFKFITERK